MYSNKYLIQILTENPAKVNESAMKDGWFIKIKIGAKGNEDLNKLMSEADYAKLTTK